MTMAELKEILEALIFVHRGVLTGKVMEGVLKDDFPPEEIALAMQELAKEYEERGGVIRLIEVAEGYELGTRNDLAEWGQKMDHYEHHRRLSRPALETLAIISYRQPVTRPEIENIRGVNVERILRSLLDKKLIRILGRKDVAGKPIVYGTTKEFLQHFGLKSLADLPSLKEFTDQALSEGDEDEGEAVVLPLEEGGPAGPGETAPDPDATVSEEGVPGEAPPPEEEAPEGDFGRDEPAEEEGTGGA